MFTTLIIPIDLGHTDQMTTTVTVAASRTTLYDATATLSASPCPAPPKSPEYQQTSPETVQRLAPLLRHPMSKIPTYHEMQPRPLSRL